MSEIENDEVQEEIRRIAKERFDKLSRDLPIANINLPSLTTRTRLPVDPKPIEADCKHYLHLLGYVVDDKQKYRLIISPFNEELTLSLMKHRDVLTDFGVQAKPCDKWTTTFKDLIYYEPVDQEIMVTQLISSDKMEELSFYTPAIAEQLENSEINVMLNSYLEGEYVRSANENSILNDKIIKLMVWIEEFVKKTKNMDTKLTSFNMEMLSKLREDDKIEFIEGERGLMTQIRDFFKNNPSVKYFLMVAGIVGMLALYLSMGG